MRLRLMMHATPDAEPVERVDMVLGDWRDVPVVDHTLRFINDHSLSECAWSIVDGDGARLHSGVTRAKRS